MVDASTLVVGDALLAGGWLPVTVDVIGENALAHPRIVARDKSGVLWRGSEHDFDYPKENDD